MHSATLDRRSVAGASAHTTAPATGPPSARFTRPRIVEPARSENSHGKSSTSSRDGPRVSRHETGDRPVATIRTMTLLSADGTFGRTNIPPASVVQASNGASISQAGGMSVRRGSPAARNTDTRAPSTRSRVSASRTTPRSGHIGADGAAALAGASADRDEVVVPSGATNATTPPATSAPTTSATTITRFTRGC